MKIPIVQYRQVKPINLLIETHSSCPSPSQRFQIISASYALDGRTPKITLTINLFMIIIMYAKG